MSEVETKIAGPGIHTASGGKPAEGRSLHGAIVGVLIGFQDEGRTPLVIFAGQYGEAAIPARATQDLHGAHIGKDVVLVFEEGDPRRPIVVGLMQRAGSAQLAPSAGQVEVDADGTRMIVTAKEQLVLRCGSASITLTKAGKVIIEGAYVSSSSSGVNRVKGGSIQLN
jgi:hypothetical protein